jgi:hypothetical protein
MSVLKYYHHLDIEHHLKLFLMCTKGQKLIPFFELDNDILTDLDSQVCTRAGQLFSTSVRRDGEEGESAQGEMLLVG